MANGWTGCGVGGALALALVATLAAAPLHAARGADLDDDELAVDRPVDRDTWPVEVTRRPLTLGRGMVEVFVPLGVNVSSGRVWKPTFVAPGLAYGVTRWLTVGVRHALGACLSGPSTGCPDGYADVGVDALWELAHGDSGDVALGTAIDVAPLQDPTALSGEVRLVVRFGGPLALTLSPTLRVGLIARDMAGVRTGRVAFPLASYAFGWVEQSAGNHEYLSLPVTVTFQLAPPVAVSLGGALDGPIGSAAGSFGDLYRVPFGLALVFTPFRALDLGASVTFADLLGKAVPAGERWNTRGMQIFGAFRL